MRSIRYYSITKELNTFEKKEEGNSYHFQTSSEIRSISLHTDELGVIIKNKTLIKPFIILAVPTR